MSKSEAVKAKEERQKWVARIVWGIAFIAMGVLFTLENMGRVDMRGPGRYPPSNAVDGRSDTRWSSAFAEPQWIAVDLEQPAEISRVRLTWEAAFASAYEIEVFVTAYDSYALRAFEVHAVDYVLKPCRAERLQEALEHARRHVRERPEPAVLANAARPAGEYARRVVVGDTGRIHLIPVERLDYAQAQDDYVALHSEGKAYLKTQTLASLEASLDPSLFVRVHRSFIVSLDRIRAVELYAKNSRMATLKDGTRVPVSREGHARLRELLGEGSS